MARDSRDALVIWESLDLAVASAAEDSLQHFFAKKMIFCIFCLSEEGDKLTFDLGPDVPGIVLDAEDRESCTNSISARDMN